MKTSIIVLSYGEAATTQSCITSVLESLDTESQELLVVDNGSPADQQNILKEFIADKPIELICNSENLGFSARCNEAAKRCNSEILVFLNNDVEVKEGWLEPLIKAISDKNVSAVSPLMLLPNGKVQQAGISFSLWGLPVNIAAGQNLPINQDQQLLGVSGACMAIRRELFEMSGGFDQQYFFSYEDIDFCLRARALGLKPKMIPDVPLIHHESASHQGSVTLQYRWKAEELFAQRWQAQITANLENEYRILTEKVRGKAGVFGTGRAGSSLVRHLQQLTDIPVAGYVVDDTSGGYNPLDLPVYPIDNLPEEIETIIIASMYGSEIEARISDKTSAGLINGLKLETEWVF